MRLRNIPRAEGVLKNSPLVIQDPASYKGTWRQAIFKNDHPVYIEIGMGKGKFILELAKKNPQINYIGIERYTSVLLRAVEKAEGVDPSATKDHTPSSNILEIYPNLRFLCIDAAEITEYFNSDEVDRIYLNFSDPWPKARHARRRLTSAEYFHRYDQILVSGGQVEFKTDNRGLFDFSVEQLNESETWAMTACTYDLHNDTAMNQGNVMTEYEEKFSSMNHPICKLVAKRIKDIS